MSKEKSRRDFIRNSLSAIAGTIVLPSIIPASALGRNGFTAPSDRIIMGSIGVGSQGISNLKDFLNFKEVQFVAVCDVDSKHQLNGQTVINQKYENTDCRKHKDYREFLEKEKLDAVCISVPDHWHSLTYIAAAQKKLDIYGEKPLARTIGEGQQIVKAVQKNNIIWQTGSWQRSQAHFHKAAELVLMAGLEKLIGLRLDYPMLQDWLECHL
jgi:predicted dehydrogenase